MSTEPDMEDINLSDWSRRLTQALQILDLEVDPQLLRTLNEKAADSVGPDAGLVSSFLVGYAAALTVSSGHKAPGEAVEKAADTVLQLSETGLKGPDVPGWKGSAQ